MIKRTPKGTYMMTVKNLQDFIQNPKKRYVYRENELQKACVKWFDLQYKKYKLLLYHAPNEGKLIGGNAEGAKRKAMGTRTGFPDLILCAQNATHPFLCMELKAANGRQTSSQKDYEKAIQTLGGGVYRIVRSFEEFQTLVSEYMKTVKQ